MTRISGLPSEPPQTLPPTADRRMPAADYRFGVPSPAIDRVMSDLSAQVAQKRTNETGFLLAQAPVQSRLVGGKGYTTPIPARQLSGYLADPRPNPATPAANSRFAGDAGLNGQAILTASAAALQRRAQRGEEVPKVYFVNGINTGYNNSTNPQTFQPFASRDQAFELSDRLDAKIVHIVNVSDPAAIAGRIRQIGTDSVLNEDRLGAAALRVRGFSDEQILAEYPNSVRNTINRTRQELLPNPPAANALANLVIADINAGMKERGKFEPIKIIAYSQGAPITAEAMRKVNDYISAKYNAQDANFIRSKIRLLGIGPAANQSHFPAGMRFNMIYDEADPIARFLGGTSNERVTAQTINQLQNFRGIEPHLSYFEGYELEDSDNIHYHKGMNTLLDRWFAGRNIAGNDFRDVYGILRAR